MGAGPTEATKNGRATMRLGVRSVGNEAQISISEQVMAVRAWHDNAG